MLRHCLHAQTAWATEDYVAARRAGVDTSNENFSITEPGMSRFESAGGSLSRTALDCHKCVAGFCSVVAAAVRRTRGSHFRWWSGV